jgi:hypothetical protein
MYWRAQGERGVETSRNKSIPRIRRRLFTCGSTLPIFRRVQARSHVRRSHSRLSYLLVEIREKKQVEDCFMSYLNVKFIDEFQMILPCFCRVWY